MQERVAEIGRRRADVVVFTLAVFAKAPFGSFRELGGKERVDELFDTGEHVLLPLVLHPFRLVFGVADEFELLARAGGFPLDDCVDDYAGDVVVGEKLA